MLGRQFFELAAYGRCNRSGTFQQIDQRIGIQKHNHQLRSTCIRSSIAFLLSLPEDGWATSQSSADMPGSASFCALSRRWRSEERRVGKGWRSRRGGGVEHNEEKK